MSEQRVVIPGQEWTDETRPVRIVSVLPLRGDGVVLARSLTTGRIIEIALTRFTSPAGSYRLTKDA